MQRAIPDIEGVLTKSIRGGKWLTLGSLIQRAIGFISFFVLARILTPSDFGIMTLVLLVPNTLQSLTETGLSGAAIQRGGNIYKYLNPIWTIGLIRSIIIALIIFILGPHIASYLHAPEAATLIRLGGIFTIIFNLGNIGEIFFFKELDFKKIFIRNIARESAYVIAALIAVYFFRSYWVLVIATIASQLTQTISTYILHPYRPKLSLNFKQLRDLFGYSKWVIGQRWLEQIYSFLEQILVARTTNIASTGLYSKAKNMASVAPGLLSPILNMVGFTALSKVKDLPEKVKEGYLRSLQILFFFIIPIALLIFVGGGKIILVLLGSQWLPMLLCLQAFLIFYVIDSLTSLSNTLLNAIGHPDKQAKLTLIKIPLTLMLMLLLIPYYGIAGPPIALIIGTLPSTFLTLFYLTKLTIITFRNIIGTLITPLTISLCLTFGSLYFKETLLTLPNNFLLIILGFIGALYLFFTFLTYRLFQRGPFPTITMIIKNLI